MEEDDVYDLDACVGGFEEDLFGNPAESPSRVLQGVMAPTPEQSRQRPPAAPVARAPSGLLRPGFRSGRAAPPAPKPSSRAQAPSAGTVASRFETDVDRLFSMADLLVGIDEARAELAEPRAGSSAPAPLPASKVLSPPKDRHRPAALIPPPEGEPIRDWEPPAEDAEEAHTCVVSNLMHDLVLTEEEDDDEGPICVADENNPPSPDEDDQGEHPTGVTATVAGDEIDDDEGMSPPPRRPAERLEVPVRPPGVPRSALGDLKMTAASREFEERLNRALATGGGGMTGDGSKLTKTPDPKSLKTKPPSRWSPVKNRRQLAADEEYYACSKRTAPPSADRQ